VRSLLDDLQRKGRPIGEAIRIEGRRQGRAVRPAKRLRMMVLAGVVLVDRVCGGAESYRKGNSKPAVIARNARGKTSGSHGADPAFRKDIRAPRQGSCPRRTSSNGFASCPKADIQPVPPYESE
jgi:hypothetical protein